MKMPKIHTQILLALILGAIAGAIFHVDQTVMVVVSQEGKKIATRTVKNWTHVQLQVADSSQTYTVEMVPLLFSRWKGLKTEQKKQVQLTFYARDSSITATYSRLKELRKEQTVATAIKPIGTIFIRLLNLIAIPLVLGSLLVGAASLGDVSKVARIGVKTLVYFMCTTAVAITIGLVLANIIRPGERINPQSKSLLLAEYRTDVQSKIEENISVDPVDMLVRMIPTNPFQALANGEMLQIVFFSVLIGLILTVLKPEKSQPLITFFDSLSETMIVLVQKVMLIAPYAVFALIAATVSEFGFGIIKTLLWYALCVLGGLILHLFLTYGTILKLFSQVSLRNFLKGMRPAQLVAFSTSSSAATLPVNFECCEENLKVPKQITSFVLPLGATINMDGTALYQGVAAAFIAQVYGFDLSLAQQLTIVLTAVLASIGTAPVPGVGIIMLIIVLKAVNVPEEGIALILGIDRFLDMCRTVLNISGDATGAVVIAASEARRQQKTTEAFNPDK
ncbi:dicarboxylate/amino acid:cation symporter [candidate division KSB1 bacterium]|nr:dicarboxylate/amino acid:cation symporter [candidate division KSB1 bacterium]